MQAAPWRGVKVCGFEQGLRGNTVNPQAVSRTPHRPRRVKFLQWLKVVDLEALWARTAFSEPTMPHSESFESVERPAVNGSDESHCRVLLVAQDPERLEVMQQCARANLPGCRIDVVSSYFDAMARATRMETHLLVLDLSMDSVLVPALKRFLARSAPQSVVHVFDDSLDCAPCSGTDCQNPSIVQMKQAFAALAAGRASPL